MPKKTFFNLSEEKRNCLLKAAKKEFSNSPFHDASISNIIKEAKISRGSFYQYFEDKEDLFTFIISNYLNNIKTYLKEQIIKKEGNLAEAFKASFYYYIDLFSKEENKKLFKHTFVNFNYSIEKKFIPNLLSNDFRTEFEPVIELIDFKVLNLKSNMDIYYVLKIFMTLTIHNLIEIFAWDIPKEKAIEIFNNEIDLITNGIYTK